MKTFSKDDFISFIVSGTGGSVTNKFVNGALKPSNFIGVSSKICSNTIASTRKLRRKIDGMITELG